VPESVKADVLFKNMKAKKENFAVVLDEYGGTMGIIAIKDIVKCIIGEIETEEETEKKEQRFEKIGDDLWRINGNVDMSDLNESLGICIDDSESDTFSGYVLGLHGNIPNDGETFEVETERLYVKALEIREHIVEKAEIFIKPEESEEKDSEESEE